MKTLRVAICVMLVVGVLAMSLSVFAIDPSPSPTPGPNDYEYPDVIIQEINEELMSRYIWLTLNAWGIRISYDEMDDFYDEVEAQILMWVMEYLESLPSAYFINQWIAPWQAGYDYWGNLALNNSALEDIQDFANWLCEEYDLTNESTTVINPIYTYGSYNLYRTNTWYRATPYGNATPNLGDFGMFKVETVGDFLWMPVILTDGIGYIFFDDATFSSVQVRNQTSDDTVNLNTNASFRVSASGTNGDGWYYGTTEYTYNDNASWYPTGGNIYESSSNWYYWTDSSSDIMRYIQVSHIVEEGDMAIITTLISLPADNPDYVEGDGLTIIDGNPQYGEIVIPDSVSVDNLPAIITQNKIPDIGNDSENPGFSVPWQAINGLIQYVAAPAGAIMSLVNEAPVEGVIMLYALIGGMIIFGMIRIMREH